ncbi:hypothetical protein KUCAC02_004289, partial [Chaenocephalus aceratus]
LFFFFFCRASICSNPVWEAEERKEATYYPFSEEVDEPSHPKPGHDKARASRGQSVNIIPRRPNSEPPFIALK